MKRVFAFAVILFSFAGILTAEEIKLKLPPYKKVKLENGMTILLMEQHEVPIISLEFIIKAGSVVDPPGKAGAASLTADLLRKGTKSRNADQVSIELDSMGGRFYADAVADYTYGSAEFLKKHIAKGLGLLADAMLNPSFPQEEVTKMIKRRIDSVKSEKDQAEEVIEYYFEAYLYSNHPYGHPSYGDEKSLAMITRDDIVNFYRSNYTPVNTILSVVGDFDGAEIEKMLKEQFASWPSKSAPSIHLPAPGPFLGKKVLLIDKPDSTQTYYMVGNIGISRTNPDRVYAEMINTLFGERFTSMLNSELRINSGLTYGASSHFRQRKVSGTFAISSFTRSATTEEAIDKTLAILKRLHEKGITEEELNSVKRYIKGQFPLSIESSDQLASLICELEFFRLDEREINDFYSKIDSMTLNDARRVIRQHFPLDNLLFVVIGKAGEIANVAKKYAPEISTKSITDPGY